MQKLIAQAIEAGGGVGLVDPHGDFAESILDLVPPHRVSDVIYFNAADFEYPIAFNLFQPVDPRRRHLVTSSVISAFRGVWGESFGVRTEWILSGCVSALLECQNASLLCIGRLLSDQLFRESVLRRVKDPGVLAFWKEFTSYDKRFASEIVAPLQNKLGALLMSANARNILGQVSNRVDMRYVMDNRRILIVNLARGLIGEERASLLGALVISSIKTAALSRADLKEDQRVPFELIVDEHNLFGTDAFSSILAESRKYALGLVLSTQQLHAIRDDVRHAIFGNCGSLISFRVGESDAAILAREFGSDFNPSLFANLANFEVCAKLLQEGRHNDPFLAKTHPPSARRYGRRDNIVRRSRRWHATPRVVVEDRIRRWSRSMSWTL